MVDRGQVSFSDDLDEYLNSEEPELPFEGITLQNDEDNDYVRAPPADVIFDPPRNQTPPPAMPGFSDQEWSRVENEISNGSINQRLLSIPQQYALSDYLRDNNIDIDLEYMPGYDGGVN
jgi:hypothetical protein